MKLKTVFMCQNCGFKAPKWMGQCPDCSEWNSLVEEVVQEETKTKSKSRAFTEFSSEIIKLADTQNLKEERELSGIAELDRLLGGGLVKGQLILLAGAPGIGKSTLMLQTAASISKGKKVLYISGEESLNQISSRAHRLGLDGTNIFLLSETNIENIIAALKEVEPEVLIIDSIQTVYHPAFSSSPGTIGQVRECAAELLRLCKPKGTILFILGHVTKDGELAGPKVLEHMVDTVLYFDTEKDNILRLLRPHKNRFGSTHEIGLFEMTQKGLLPVEDASTFFTESSRSKPLIGRAYSIALEGTRPILVEVQALVTPTRYPFPRRVATGLDFNRCQVLLASIEKNAGVSLDSKDVYISLAGGVKIKDPALDLALCAAVISSAKDIPLSNTDVFVAEVGILGPLAKVPLLDRRIAEAARLGFKRVITSSLTKDEAKTAGVSVAQTEGIADLLPKLGKN
ncbi:DNA repair protein RadA/Sms [Elusimicrobium simillimum]|uniref:DNA repair protein RadA n=1 Tax=Elusimicrobium simillimum TaxID=3143438 RepID=UPI003C7019A6